MSYKEAKPRIPKTIEEFTLKSEPKKTDIEILDLTKLEPLKSSKYVPEKIITKETAKIIERLKMSHKKLN